MALDLVVILRLGDQ